MLRWEDCVKRDVRKAGEEEDWKKKTRDRGGWKRLSDEAVENCGQHLTPDKGKRGRERESLLLDLHVRTQFFTHKFAQLTRSLCPDVA